MPVNLFVDNPAGKVAELSANNTSFHSTFRTCRDLPSYAEFH
jgi:hypothetical protein